MAARAATILLVLAEFACTCRDSMLCARTSPFLPLATSNQCSDECAKERSYKTPLLGAAPGGADVLILVERPGEWEKGKKDAALATIQEMYTWARTTERTHVARVAVVRYDLANPEEVDVVMGWSSRIPSQESLSTALAPGGAPGEGGQDSVLSSLSVLEALYTEWIPLGGVVGRNELESSPTHLELLQERDLHVILLVGLGREGTCDGVCTPPQSPQQFQERAARSIATIVGSAERKWNVTISVLSSATRHLLTLGDPGSSVTYSDGSHFNKALSLQRLIGGGKSSSLQALLLAQGVSFRVLGQQEWQGGRATALLGEGAIHTRFSSRCPEAGCDVCSPLHGCVGAGQERTADIVSVGDAEEEMAGTLVLTDFIRSHGDATASGSPQVVRGGAAHKLSIQQPPRCHWKPLSSVATDTVAVWQWAPTKPFVGKLIKNGRPVVLQNSAVRLWPALSKWSWNYLQRHLGRGGVTGVKCTNSYLTFDPDPRAALKLNVSLPFVTRNMTSQEFVQCLTSPSECSDGFKGHYYFTELPPELAGDTLPDELLFHTSRDHTAKRQFLWVSSAGMITHGHFDQDYNVFVQLKGRKRFTLWSPWQHELLYMYPRVHPMWHKSRVNFQQPDWEKFPLFGKSRASQVTLEPGDTLFVPPYTWHYVETLNEPSVSMSTWSHDYELYDHMNAVYRHDHKFDLIQSKEGQMYALRLYLDMMVHELYGFNQTGEVFARLLQLRFEGLADLFPPHPSDPQLCGRRREGRIPTAVHVHGFVSLDVGILSPHFKALPLEVMDILFFDYVEEISAQVVGVEKLLAFFRYCFLGQTYYTTDPDSPEHSLWDHKDATDD